MKRNKLRIALLQTLLVFTIGVCGLVYFAYWIADTDDSEFARKARDFTGIPKVNKGEKGPSPDAPDEVAPGPGRFDIPIEPADEPLNGISTISFAELAWRKTLWPEVLTLKLNIDLAIRYKGTNFGTMRFIRGRTVEVLSIFPNGEILCGMDGNFINLSVYETDLYGWFREAHGENYELTPVTVEFNSLQKNRYSIDTKEGQAAFWAEMRSWCNQHYDSPLLSAEEDGLVFYWVPREKAPIEFNSEAGEIARQYLLRRARYGGRENFAPCEIRNPNTDETLGTASLYIPRL